MRVKPITKVGNVRGNPGKALELIPENKQNEQNIRDTNRYVQGCQIETQKHTETCGKRNSILHGELKIVKNNLGFVLKLHDFINT